MSGVKKILVMGLPGSGKTDLARALASKIKAVHFNDDEIRREISKDLSFNVADHVEQARRMGVLCDIVNRAGYNAIADFICPTVAARNVFRGHFIIWLDTRKGSPYPETNKLFEPPIDYNMRLTVGAPEFWVERIVAELG